MKLSEFKAINQLVQNAISSVAHLQCDGATRVMNYLLTQEGIAHIVMTGTASFEGSIIPHFWIQIENMKIDLKSRMCFGDTVPEGFFKDSPAMYLGQPKELKTNAFIYKILTNTPA